MSHRRRQSPKDSGTAREDKDQQSLQRHLESETFDDACSLGRFCLNPCGFLFQLSLDRYNKWCSRESRELQKPPAQSDKVVVASSHASMTTSPLIPAAYPVVATIVWVIVILKVFPVINDSPSIPSYHKVLGRIACFLCTASWVWARTTRPGNITVDTIARFDNYPYDHFLYVPDNVCPTLRIRKLARSKYDRYTGRHVPRFDHYCGWLGNAIGEENYRVFLCFLLVHCSIAIYGAVILCRILLLSQEEAVKEQNVREDESLFSNLSTGLNGWVFLLALLLLILCPALVGLFGFHVYLLFNGMTTNEYYKRKQATAWVTASQQRQRHTTTAKSDIEEQKQPSSRGQIPANIYNLGVLANMAEVVYPRSLRAKHLQDGLNRDAACTER